MHGYVYIADTQLTFNETVINDRTLMRVVVTDTFTGKSSARLLDPFKFLKALSIFVHPDGSPNADVDYPDAEDVQPLNPDGTPDLDLRFIP